MMIDVPTYQGLPNVAPWQFAGAGGLGSGLPGQYGQGLGGPGAPQLNGALTQPGLSPLAAACLAAQATFANVLGQYAQLASGVAAGPQLAGQPGGWPGLGLAPFFSPFIGLGGSPGAYGQPPYGQQSYGQLQYGQQPFGQHLLGQPGIGGWPGHQQLGGGMARLGFGLSPIAAASLAHQSMFGGGINPALAGLSAGAFGQRGPWSGVGRPLPFAIAPQMAYAG